MSVSQLLPPMSRPPPAAFRLLDGTGTVGWIEGPQLAFTGFNTIDEAAAAAWVAHVALERRAAKSRREAATYLEPDALQLAWSDGGEWIRSGSTRLARLIRPAEPRPEDIGGSSFAIDVALPRGDSEIEVGSSAHVVYRALRRSGVRWPIRDRPSIVSDGRADGDAESLAQVPLTAVDIPRVAGRRLAMSEQPDRLDDEVESASLDSFPASDPPKWSGLRLGPPMHSEIAPDTAEQKDTVAARRRFDSTPTETHVGERA
jgi:hypothetical protein